MTHNHVEVPVAQPAAGADWSVVISSNDEVQLLTMRATLTTSVTVDNRAAHFQVVNPSGQIIHEIAMPAVAAGAAVTYSGVAGTGFYNTSLTVEDGILSIPLPNLWWPDNVTIRSKTTLLQSGDQWSGIYLSALVGDSQGHLRELEAITAAVNAIDLGV
jgi:hypothetical protein